MHSTKQSTRRKLAHNLASLSSVLVFSLISLALILTQLATLQPLTSGYSKPNHLPASESAKALPPAIPLLDDTPVLTNYLPIVMHPPAETVDCNPSHGSGGLASGIHITTVAGLNAVVVVGDAYNPQNPTYLAFYLHGDEGNYLQFKFASNKVTKFVREQNWVFVAPQSPNQGDSWWTNWQGDHNEALAQAFKEMSVKYNLCGDAVFGSTLSGGSEFWSKSFFPNKGGEHPAYTVMFCGGALPNTAGKQKVTVLGQNPDIVARSSFEFVYGSEDFLYNSIQKTIQFYTEAGFEVSNQELPGVDHCVPDFIPRIVTHWTERAAKLGLN